MSLIRRSQLHNRNDITPACAGVPALDEFAGPFARLSLFIDFLGELLLCRL